MCSFAASIGITCPIWPDDFFPFTNEVEISASII